MSDLPVRIELTALGVNDWGGTMEVGLQDSAGNLDPGTPAAGGAVRYECELRCRRRDDGSIGWLGPHAHGPTQERFLYISYRPRDGSAKWQRRTKILLPTDLDGDPGSLSATVRDVGRSRVTFTHDWTPA